MTQLLRPLSQIKRQSPEALLAALANTDSPAASADAASRLISEVKSYGIEMRDYLRLACDGSMSNRAAEFSGLNGYEVALKFLNLPVQDDFDAGIVLDLASDTFQTSPGTRALFPEVIDDLVRWKYRQDKVPSTAVLNGLHLSGLPIPSRVEIDGIPYVVDEAEIELDLDHTGQYRVEVKAAPQHTIVFQVTK